MKVLLAAAAAALGALLIAGPTQAQQPAPAPSLQPAPVKRTPLGKVEVPGSDQEVIFGMVEIAPGFKAGRHSHPGTVIGYIIEGEFWLALDGQPERIVKTGESVEIRDKAIHNEGNASGDKPLKFLVVYVVEKGKPLVQPVQ